MSGLSASYPQYAPVEDLNAYLGLEVDFEPGVIVWSTGERIDLERDGRIVTAHVYPNGVSQLAISIKPYPQPYFAPAGSVQSLSPDERYIIVSGQDSIGFAMLDAAPYSGMVAQWLVPEVEAAQVPNGLELLQRASAAIRTFTKTAVYRVDSTDGYTPTDTRIRDAFHDAAILQAAGLYRAGVKPGDLVATQTAEIQSKSLGGRSVTYAVDAGTATARAELINGKLTPEAASVLSSAGLLGTGVQTGGGTEYDILLRRWI